MKPRYMVNYGYWPSKAASESRENRCLGRRFFKTRRAAERFLQNGDKRHSKATAPEPFGVVHECRD